jgi:diphosphomevalonate decarboxylase
MPDIAPSEHVILVDPEDNPIGTAEKLAAHREALCHRAFSIFIFRYRKQVLELLLQQRSTQKYHGGGLWTNTCCSHPRPGEDTLSAAYRRLNTEMGFSAPLKTVGVFHYFAQLDNGYSENEIDHVLIGFCDTIEQPDFAPEEIQATQWMSITAIEQDLARHPKRYTPWFKQALGIASDPTNF